MKPRVLLLACDGLLQRHLALRLVQHFELVGVVLQRDTAARETLPARLARYRSPRELLHYLTARIDSWRVASMVEQAMTRWFPQSAELGLDGIPVLEVGNINDRAVPDFIQQQAPDLVCVNGTRLIRQPLLGVIPALPLGMINLHTGLSPYARGGNCNLFALLDGHPEWVGVTVHHIDPGIDSGDIIYTHQVTLKAGDCYQLIDLRTFHQGFELMLVAINDLVSGQAPRVPQWEAGKLYLKRTGYEYKPYHVYRLNQSLRKGLVAEYLADKTRRDAGVRLIEPGHIHAAD